ncbi:DUF3817 domain-containing protein [Salinibius halmophilus]|uniref:DUF3817 domain-containing protein n=1 Tax=Salinibius halmophilus TaxID=1853216 RepID=UPI000E663BEC|nr:DUF3817 domain-containing protein [Salinibius halmophilus]
MLNFFRLVSVIEGISYLLILSVTLGWLSRDYVSVLGMGHGVLFVIYIAALFACALWRKWTLLYTLMLFIASLIPFAFIAVEWHLKQTASKQLASK